MYQMMGVFAEFERAIIRERVLLGLPERRLKV
jgi:DNA invertase Pin-like site-specific DNA recombinase